MPVLVLVPVAAPSLFHVRIVHKSLPNLAGLRERFKVVRSNLSLAIDSMFSLKSWPDIWNSLLALKSRSCHERFKEVGPLFSFPSKA
jgi:hypothetical protein